MYYNRIREISVYPSELISSPLLPEQQGISASAETVCFTVITKVPMIPTIFLEAPRLELSHVS